MRRVQAAALDLFEAQGFEAVTIEAIAQAAGVSAPTVYRGFGSKERIVLWDDYDPMLLEAIGARVKKGQLWRGVEEALVACLDEVYQRDKSRILRRSRLMLRLPALRAAATADQTSLIEALAKTLLRARVAGARFEAQVLAASVVATLAVAVEEWTRRRGRAPLSEVLREAFAHRARAC